MFSKILITLLVCLVAFTSAWPTASSILPRDTSAKLAANLFVYRTTSSDPNVIAGAKKCQAGGSLVKLEEGVCYTIPSDALGMTISSFTSGCKVWAYGTTTCTPEEQQVSAGCFDISDKASGSTPLSLKASC
ncbi:hypothetical protein BLS_000072 [Venturia inaequalis]|uniref:Uncharacterized protein n=1 Tax=Venturia inaequalis TaxID=5025 RepID=A0A8H3Z405_VENIN|nr:hypothetical protein EG328_008314 [Venturia inaequalis]KAE9972545.1 hypothetical protein EG327_009460 [Venturia inaequalis]KAE9985045.1 hypothetical protein BLS_000072 [Venturia inaequalis]